MLHYRIGSRFISYINMDGTKIPRMTEPGYKMHVYSAAQDMITSILSLKLFNMESEDYDAILEQAGKGWV